MYTISYYEKNKHSKLNLISTIYSLDLPKIGQQVYLSYKSFYKVLDIIYHTDNNVDIILQFEYFYD